MRYLASITDFFKSPKWGTNLLLGAVTGLIPVIGPLVLNGWLITVFWARGDDDAPERMPTFDFQCFTKYLERGLWPFLVNLVAGLAMSVVLVPLMFLPLLLSGVLTAGQVRFEHAEGLVAVFLVGTLAMIYVGFALIGTLVLVPLTLRATLTQAFGAAFDPGFVREFIGLVWKELLLCAVFMVGVGIAMMIVAVITCYIGLFPAIPVVSFAWQHLLKQVYQCYRSRGGTSVPLSPRLNDLPPALPPPAPPPPPPPPFAGAPPALPPVAP
jgi:hypothetical protein